MRTVVPLPLREGLGVGAISNNNVAVSLNSPLPDPPRKGEGTQIAIAVRNNKIGTL